LAHMATYVWTWLVAHSPLPRHGTIRQVPPIEVTSRADWELYSGDPHFQLKKRVAK
jgi:hypothetical protein